MGRPQAGTPGGPGQGRGIPAPPRPAPLGAGSPKFRRQPRGPSRRWHEPCGGTGGRQRRAGRAPAAMPKERPLWRGLAFRLCLLSAALFLCLQLGMRRSWCPEEKPRAAAAAGRVPPPARGTEQQAGAVAAAGRRRVTYVRSGRRGSAVPGCCPLQPPAGRRRKVRRAGGSARRVATGAPLRRDRGGAASPRGGAEGDRALGNASVSAAAGGHLSVRGSPNSQMWLLPMVEMLLAP